MKAPLSTIALVVLAFACTSSTRASGDSSRFALGDLQFTDVFGFLYNQRRLFELGALDSPERMIEWLTDQGIKVFDLSGDRAQLTEDEAYYWKFLNDSKADRAPPAGGYLAAHKSLGKKGHRLFPTQRPFGDSPVIILTNTDRHIILHEYFHHLITEQHVRISGKSAAEYQQHASTLIDELNDRLSQPPGKRDAVAILRLYIVNARKRLMEEIAINQTLLKFQKELQLAPSGRKHLLERLHLDFISHMGTLYTRMVASAKKMESEGVSMKTIKAVLPIWTVHSLKSKVSAVARRALLREPSASIRSQFGSTLKKLNLAPAGCDGDLKSF